MLRNMELRNRDFSVCDKEVPNLIRRLRKFFGSNEIDKYLLKYERALRTAGPIYSEYYLKTRHPWWKALIAYKKLEKSGKAIFKNVTSEILNLAADAKMISILRHEMPESVILKYKHNLLEDESAKSYLFELDIAWHYHLNGYKILWHEDKCKSGPEFTVETDNFAFDVECKRLAVDVFRKLRRKDFYHLVEIFLPELSKMGFLGRVVLDSNDRLPSNMEDLRSISNKILQKIEKGDLEGTFSLEHGDVTLDLKKGTKRRVNLKRMYEEFWGRKPPEALGVIFASSFEGDPVDPIEMTCKSKKAGNVLQGIQKKLAEASVKQLDPEKPGLIACLIPEIDDFKGLENNSGLQVMTHNLFENKKHNHLSAVVYNSDKRFVPTEYGLIADNQALLFRNPFCKYDIARKFNFISKDNFYCS